MSVRASSGLPAIVALSIVTLLGTGCSTTAPRVTIDPAFPFAAHRVVGLYIPPAGSEDLERLYAHVLRFELISKGYDVVDLALAVDSLRPLVGGPFDPKGLAAAAAKVHGASLVAFATMRWDSAVIYTHHDVRTDPYEVRARLYGIRSPQLYGSLEFIDPSSRAVVLSAAATDTCQVYLHPVTREVVLQEYPWMVAARQIRRATGRMPEIESMGMTRASVRLPTVVYVDATYREHFGPAWRDRVQRRLLFANDLLKGQFDLELEVREIVSWSEPFAGSLEATLLRLQSIPGRAPGTFRIGVTLDARLRENWRDRHVLGLGIPLGWHAAITAQPSFPDVADWNAHEEALTIVHEVAHVLGAQHVPFASSVMYPMAGSFALGFDHTNARIIDHMKAHFARSADSVIAREFVRIHAQLRTELPQNGLNILDPVARAVLGLHLTSTFRSLQVGGLDRTVDRLVPDESIRSAVHGYIAFRQQKFAEARRHLERAVALEPTFAEAHWFLGQSLQMLGESASAELHRKRSNELRPAWMRSRE